MEKKSCIAFVLLVSIISVCFSGCYAEPQEIPADLESVSVREAVASEEDVAIFRKIFESETAYLASLQLENGAIPMAYSENGTLTMNPYFADFAALALLYNADAARVCMAAYVMIERNS